jgi:cbb3-type cytochrome oxidase subunit 3
LAPNFRPKHEIGAWKSHNLK